MFPSLRPQSARLHATLLGCLWLASSQIWAFQERPRIYAIEGVKIVVSPETTIEKGSIVLRDGLIQAVGADVAIPDAAQRIAPPEGESWTVYPAFIDAAAFVALKTKKKEEKDGDPHGPHQRGPKPKADKASGMNPDVAIIRPQHKVIDAIDANSKELEKHRDLGFGIANVVAGQGLFRGRSAIISMRKGDIREILLDDTFAQVFELASSKGGGAYPRVKIGSVAAARQYVHDVIWRKTWQDRYQKDPTGLQRPPRQDGDGEMQEVLDGKTPLLFVSKDNRSYERFNDFTAEFSIKNTMVLGHGGEWADLVRLKSTSSRFLYPMILPKKPKLDKPEDAARIPLKTMQAYLGAPALPGKLQSNGVPFVMVTAGMKDTASFHENLKRVIDAGLSEADALAALTTTPAKWLGLSQRVGTLEAGKIANLLVVKDTLFKAKPDFRYIFVDGIDTKVDTKKKAKKKAGGDGIQNPVGSWQVEFSAGGQEQELTFIFKGEPGNYSGSWDDGEESMNFQSVTVSGSSITIVTPSPAGVITVEGTLDGDNYEGTADMQTPDGTVTITFTGTRLSSDPQGGQQ